MYRIALALALIVLTLGALAACAPATAPTTTPPTAAAPPLISSPQATTETMPTTAAPTSGAMTTPAGGATTPAAVATTSETGAAPTEAATSAATAASTSAATAAATGGPAAGAQTITVKGTEFKFDPSQITLKVGQPVTIVFTNAGSVDHELEVENMPASNVTLDLSKAGKIPEDQADEAKGDAANNEVHAYAAGGGTATVTFTPTKAGTYNSACNLPGHKEAGMVGTITVQ